MRDAHIDGLDLSTLASHLSYDEQGIWRAPAATSVSYPATATAECFAVEDDSFWFNHRNDCILQMVSRDPCAGPFLDIGGGNGYVSSALQKQGLSVICLEPSEEGAMNARRRGVRNVVCSTLQAAGIKPAAVAAAGLFDVLEHIEDDRALLTLIHSTLPPRGRLYITVPANPRLWSREDEQAGHYRRYSPDTLCAVLDAAGFSVDYPGHCFGFLVLPVLLLRRLAGGLPGHKTAAHSVNSREHRPPWGPVRYALAWLTRRELKALKKGRIIASGTTLLVAATARSV